MALCCCIGLWLRTYQLASLPAEMHRDELAIGYNAFSLVHTAHDEHGTGPWPRIFASFGDYKLPGLIYVTAVAVRFAGLSVWSVRIGTALLATALVPLTYVFVVELFRDRRQALVATALLSVSYWHVFLARTAYEPIAALTVWVGALILLLKGRRHVAYILASAVLFAVSFAFYNLPLLLSPFVLLVYCICFWPQLRSRLVQSVASLGIIAVLILITIWSLSTVSLAKSKTTVFNNAELNAHLQEFKDAAFIAQTPEIFRLLAVNKYLFWSTQVFKNYTSAFDVHYLFFSGGKNVWHNLNSLELGNFNIMMLPLLLVGLAALVRSSVAGSRPHWFLLGYLLVAPIPDAITIDAPVTNRLLDFHFALTLVAALGLTQLLTWSKRKAVVASLTVGLVAAFGYFACIFCIRYFYLHATKQASAWNETIGEAAALTAHYSPQFQSVYVNSGEIPGSFDSVTTPYIHFLFASQFDPRTVQEQAIWQEQGGFQTIGSVGAYHFVELPRPGHVDLEPILYVTRTDLTELDPHFTVTPVFTTANRAGRLVWRAYALATHE